MAEFYYPAAMFGLSHAFKFLVELADDQFKTLIHAIREHGFSQSRQETQSLARSLGMKPSKLVSLLRSCEFLYEAYREAEPGDPTIDGLTEWLEYTSLAEEVGEPAKLLPRLLEILSRNQKVDRDKKLKWLRTGIMPTATEFASFIELRPNIAADRQTLGEFVPVIIFRVVTESEYDHVQFQAFQLTLEGLAKLRQTVEDVEKKLRAIGQDAALKDRVLSSFDKSGDE